MQCKHCGATLPENAKFCPKCGQRVEEIENEESFVKVSTPVQEAQENNDYENDETNTTVEAEEADEETKEEYNENDEEYDENNNDDEVENEEDEEFVEATKWYYVANNQAVGPISEDEMILNLKNHVINEETLVWKSGFADWVKLSDTELKVETEIPEIKDEAQWYYIDKNNAQNGPFSLEQMKTLLQAGQIFGNTFVWKTGMADWVRLKNTELAVYATPEAPNTRSFQNQEQSDRQSYSNVNTNSNYSNTSSNSQIFIMERSIGLSIVLAIVTCGIYSYYWLYCLARDINVCCNSQNKPRVAEPGIVLLLTIVTCGLYGIYFYWKAGKALSQLEFNNGFQVPDNSIIMLVMPILGLGIISMAICQSTLNDIARYANR